MILSGGEAVWSRAILQLPVLENFSAYLSVAVWQCGRLRNATTSRVDMSDMPLSGVVAVWSHTKFQLPVQEIFLLV